jgi:TolA-binding protein
MLASCSPSATKKAAEIEKLENELKESSKNNVADTAKVKVLLNDYRAYAKAFPADSLTPIFLMKCGKFYDFMSQPDSAILCYHTVYINSPTFSKSNLALFSEAFIYGNEKHDLAKAGALYKEYITKFPNTSLAKSAALELNNLGKTPEQIMAELDSMKKANGDNTAAKP